MIGGIIIFLVCLVSLLIWFIYKAALWNKELNAMEELKAKTINRGKNTTFIEMGGGYQ